MRKVLTLQDEAFFSMRQIEDRIESGESDPQNELTKARLRYGKYQAEFLDVCSDQNKIHQLRGKAESSRGKAISKSLIVIERKYFSAEVQTARVFFDLNDVVDLRRKCQELNILTNCSFKEGNLIGFYSSSPFPAVLVYLHMEYGHLGLNCTSLGTIAIPLPSGLRDEFPQVSIKGVIDLYNQSLLPGERKLQISRDSWMDIIG